MNTEERGPQFPAQVNVKMSEQLKKQLLAIHEKHGIAPPEILRRLGEAAVQFYETHGWFAFPAIVRPLDLTKPTPRSTASMEEIEFGQGGRARAISNEIKAARNPEIAHRKKSIGAARAIKREQEKEKEIRKKS